MVLHQILGFFKMRCMMRCKSIIKIYCYILYHLGKLHVVSQMLPYVKWAVSGSRAKKPKKKRLHVHEKVDYM